MKNKARLITAMVTPMTASGEVDLGACAELARILVNNGSDGIVVTGTTGESPTLSNEEKASIWGSVKAAVGDDIFVIAGATNYSTQESIAGADAALNSGADALLLTVPYYNKPNQEGLFEHFKTIAEATPLPCVLYNVPSRTSLNMSAETTIKLSQLDNIIGIKEASSDMDQIAKIINSTDADFLVWSGNDADIISVMAMGGDGVVSVASHIVGNELKSIINFIVKGDINSANNLNSQLLDLYDVLFLESNPMPIKWALNHLGFDAGKPRLPLIEPNQNTRKKLVNEINKLSNNYYSEN
ncbi:MAG: 4-hydroxy-tetrahydrodipicolinate synthase [Chloroflexi bacterium]|nr:4-hydroxy-tetrahydrodipicolinate synthase [Chloroflexota bacterium]|tara:strand:- start:725 stop:1621 length:897 start_codon:yes stop_codon:yes gene_type:complete